MGSEKRKASVITLLGGKVIRPTIVLMQMVTVCCRCAVEYNAAKSSGLFEDAAVFNNHYNSEF